MTASTLAAARAFTPVPYDANGPLPAGNDTLVLWDFDGDSADSAQPADHGAVSGGHSYPESRPGFGQTLDISEGRVSTGFDAAKINGTQQVTMAAWIKPRAALAGAYVAGGASGFLRFNGAGRLNAGFATSNDWVEAAGGESSDRYVGQWTHVAATFDRGTVTLYVNGEPVASASSPGATISASRENWTGQFHVGGAPWDPGDYSYNGQIDDVRLTHAAFAAPVVRWNLNERAGRTAADSAAPVLGGENNGTLNGDGLVWTAGKSGGGLLLHGVRGHVSAPVDGKLLGDTQQVTMSAWIKPSAPQQSTYILGLGGSVGFLRFNWQGRLNAGFWTTAGWAEAAGGQTSPWYVGQWTHVAATFDRGTVSVYVNGAPVASNTFPGAVYGPPETFLFGAVPWDLTDESKFQGTVDDVQLFNTAVPQAAAPPAEAADGLVAGPSLAGGVFRAWYAGAARHTYEVEQSSDLRTWSRHSTLHAGSGGLVRFAAAAGNPAVPARFFRLRPASLLLWSPDTLTKAFADGHLPGAASSTMARADAMRGESEPVQLVVGSRDYEGEVAVRLEPLRHESGAMIDTVDLKLVTEQTASGNALGNFQTRKPLRPAPATFPDALEPIRPFSLAPNAARAVWATIRVPRGATPGFYRGDFVVTAGGKDSRFPVELRVYDATLPEKPAGSFGTWAGVAAITQNLGWVSLDNHNYDDPRFWALLEKALVSHREHRLNMFTDVPFWAMAGLVDVTRKADGSYVFDYTKFDRFPALMDKVFGGDWRVVSTGLPLDSKIRDAGGNLVGQFPPVWNFNDPGFAAYAAVCLQDLTRHLQEKGWLEKLWFTYRDEPGMYGEGVADHAGVYGRLKELAPDLRFMVTLVFPGYWQDIPSLDLGVLSWDTAKRNLAPVRAGTALGRRGTLYNNYSAMLDQPLISFRVTAPVVYHTGLEGYYHWAWWWANPTVNGETYLPNWGPGEGFLVYQTNPPGEFIGSLRYEQLREISEDYDLYKMAEAAGIDAKSYALRQAPGLLEFSDNTGDYFRVRRELLEALEEAPAAR